MRQHHGPPSATPNAGPDDETDAPRPEPAQPLTLGQRLSEVGLAVALRHQPVFAWTPAFHPVLERVQDRSRRFAERFERAESGPAASVGSPRPRHPLPGLEPPLAAAQDAWPETARPLPVDLRARLHDVAGPGAEAMQVSTGPRSDAAARARHADAVTIGQHVHLRAGRFQPDSDQGFALLAHEASHVSALLSPDRARQRRGPGGPAAEEAAAEQVEAVARRQARPGWEAAQPTRWNPRPPARDAALRRSGPPRQPGPAPDATTAVAARAGQHPAPAAPIAMRAAEDRPEAAAAPFDVEALRRSLIEDLMHRVRTDFERGG